MYPKLVGWLPAIALVPFLGALLNGTLGRRLGKSFVTIIGVGAPAIAFSITAAFFAAMWVRDHQVVLQGDRAAIERVQQRLEARPDGGLRCELEDDPWRPGVTLHDQVYLRIHDGITLEFLQPPPAKT